MGKRTQRTGSFVAIDAKGNRHAIDVFTEYIDVSGTGAHEEIQGIQVLKTRNGDPVRRVGKGKYSIPGFNTKLTSDDPAAP